MWGQKWGQMIWGAPPHVPAIGVWALLLLAAVLIVFGLRRIRAPRRTIAVVALLLAVAVPLTARAITLPFTFTNGTVADATQVNANFAALASGRLFGFVRANGSLDPDINGGIVDVNKPATGLYCIKLGAPARSAIASVDPSTVGFVSVAMTFVPHDGAAGLSGCPTGFNDAAVVVKNATNGAVIDGGFYISFF